MFIITTTFDDVDVLIGYKDDTVGLLNVLDITTNPLAFERVENALDSKLRLNVEIFEGENEGDEDTYVPWLEVNKDKLNESDYIYIEDFLGYLEDENADKDIAELIDTVLKYEERLNESKLPPHTKYSKFKSNTEVMLKETVDRNVTLRQKVPTDKLFISVPSIEDVFKIYDPKSKNNNTHSRQSETSTTNLFSDNSNDSELNDSEQDGTLAYEDLNSGVNATNFNVNSIFKYYDSIKYKDIITRLKKDIDYKLIEGNPDNNTPNIYLNEQEYFDTLSRLVLQGLVYEHQCYTNEELNSLVSKGIRSKVVDKYLKDLCRDIFNLNWAHTGCASLNETQALQELEDSDIEFDAPTGYYTVTVDSTTGEEKVEPLSNLFFNKINSILNYTNSKDENKDSYNVQLCKDGVEIITEYCDNTIMNTFTWVYAVIQLIRWGERKPTSLYIPSLSQPQMYLDIAKNFNITNFSGNTNDLEEQSRTLTGVVVGKAEDFYLLNTIKNTYALNNLNYDSEIIYGVVEKVTYKNSDVESLNFYSLLDIFNKTDKPFDFDGLTFDNGKFNVSVELDKYTIGQLDTLSSDNSIIFRSHKSVALVRMLVVMNRVLGDFNSRKCDDLDVIRALATAQNFEDVLLAQNVVQYKDDSDEKREIVNTFTSKGYDTSTLVKYALFSTMVLPYLQITDGMNKDVNSNDYTSILTDAYNIYRVTCNNPLTRQTQSKGISSQFSLGIKKCKNFLKYMRGDEVMFYVGHCNGVVSGEATMIFFMWLPNEFDLKPDTYKDMTPGVYTSNIHKKYLEFVNKPEYSKQERSKAAKEFLSTRCLCATDKTFKACFDIVSEDVRKSKEK